MIRHAQQREYMRPYMSVCHTLQVVVGVGDPNPLVASSGLATLRSAGITVAVMDGDERQSCYDLNLEFMARMEAEVAAA